jgi:thioesterase domain-containing protein
VAEMAADYVEQIRLIQRTGPYHLLGFSVGGQIAHEMATQLRAAGEEVAVLVMVASYPPMGEQGVRGEIDLPREVPGGPPAGIGPRGMGRRAEPTQLDTTDEYARIIESLRRQAASVVGALSDQEAMNMARVFRNTRAIGRIHEYGEFDGDLLFLASGKDEPRDWTAAEYFKPYVTGKITEIKLPIAHASIFDPETIRAIWSAISAWLAGKS